jgi:hypothetical protein
LIDRRISKGSDAAFAAGKGGKATEGLKRAVALHKANKAKGDRNDPE